MSIIQPPKESPSKRIKLNDDLNKTQALQNELGTIGNDEDSGKKIYFRKTITIKNILVTEVVIDKCILDESTNKVTFTKLEEKTKERPSSRKQTIRKYSSAVRYSEKNENSIKDLCFSSDSDDSGTNDDDDEHDPFNNSRLKTSLKKKISFHQFDSGKEPSERESLQRKRSRSKSEQNEIIEVDQTPNENINIDISCSLDDKKTDKASKKTTSQPTSSSLVITKKKKLSSPASTSTEVKDEPEIIEAVKVTSNQSKPITRGKRVAMKTTPKPKQRKSINSTSTTPPSNSLVHDPKDQLKKYPPRYLYNNRYTKLDNNEENDDDEDEENNSVFSGRNYGIKTRKTSSSRTPTLPKPVVAAPSSAAVLNISQLKYNLKTKEKNEDLEELNNALRQRKISDVSSRRKDSDDSDLAIKHLHYPPLDKEANSNDSVKDHGEYNNDDDERSSSISLNLIGGNETGSILRDIIQPYENANIVQQEVTIDNTETNNDEQYMSINSIVSNLEVKAKRSNKKPPKASNRSTSREQFISTDKILNNQLSPGSLKSFIYMKIKKLKSNFECRVSINRLSDETIKMYARKPQLNHLLFDVNQIVFLPIINDDFYKAGLIKKIISDSSSQENKKSYKCLILKTNKNVSTSTDESDEENNQYITLSASEIIPIGWLNETDEVEVVEEKNSLKRARIVGNAMDTKFWLNLELMNRKKIR